MNRYMETKGTESKAFIFYTRLNLSELTGIRAHNLKELITGLEVVPDSCIYHHTHKFLQQHQHVSPEPPNDFAYWVGNTLSEKNLGEELASIDIMRFNSIADLRNEIIKTIERCVKEKPTSQNRFANKDEAFHFIKSLSFIFATRHQAANLNEFCEALKSVTVDSIYFHIFEARLRLGKTTNDFSEWIDGCLNEPKIASAIARLDPYTYTLEELRESIIRLVRKDIRGSNAKY